MLYYDYDVHIYVITIDMISYDIWYDIVYGIWTPFVFVLVCRLHMLHLFKQKVTNPSLFLHPISNKQKQDVFVWSAMALIAIHYPDAP